jgi:hypothetical protein
MRMVALAAELRFCQIALPHGGIRRSMGREDLERNGPVEDAVYRAIDLCHSPAKVLFELIFSDSGR